MRDIPLYFWRSAAVQLRTTVSAVSTMSLARGRGMRNLVPSAATSNVFQLPVCPGALFIYPESNSGRGSENSKVVPVARTSTPTIRPKLALSM